MVQRRVKKPLLHEPYSGSADLWSAVSRASSLQAKGKFSRPNASGACRLQVGDTAGQRSDQRSALLYAAQVGSLVPMHVKNRREALHEPWMQKPSAPRPSPPGVAGEEREKALPQWVRDDLAPSPREERAGRGGPFWFHGPCALKRNLDAFHTPRVTNASHPHELTFSSAAARVPN